jgi:hypothetical protein
MIMTNLCCIVLAAVLAVRRQRHEVFPSRLVPPASASLRDASGWDRVIATVTDDPRNLDHLAGPDDAVVYLGGPWAPYSPPQAC